MSEHHYILQPYKGIKTRHQCPECQQKDKSFTLYIDRETGEPLSDNTGRCEHVNKCGYHYTPKQYFADNGISPENKPYLRSIPKPHPPVSYIDTDVLKKSLTDYEANDFVKFLHTLFDAETVSKLIARYFIGTSNHWQGATTFWQLDITGKVRTGKIMLYSPVNGKRVKEPFNYITWAHTGLKLQNFNLKQSLFGEHLINSNLGKPIAMVESEKTAIIASVYLPQLLWLACGSLQNLTADRCQPLVGRCVKLYPDLGAFNRWNVKAKELGFTVSDILERNATEADKDKGLDIADYLIGQDWRKLRPQPELQPIKLKTDTFKTQQHKLTTLDWLPELNELEHFFNSITLPKSPYQINAWSVCHDVNNYVDTNLSIARRNNGNKTYFPYYQRLQALQQMINTQLELKK